VVRAQDPLARVAGSDDVVWYATNRTYRSRISAALDIAAPTELVFATYIDRFPDWQRSVALRPVGSDGRLVGREFAASYSIFGRRFEGRFRIVDADPPRFVRIEARGAGGIRVWYATSFAPTEDGRTHLDVLGDYDVPGTLFPRVQRLVLEQVIGRDIDRAHADLVALCEREIEREMTTEAASTASTTASPR
jgi:hypothetical protein